MNNEDMRRKFVTSLNYYEPQRQCKNINKHIALKNTTTWTTRIWEEKWKIGGGCIKLGLLSPNFVAKDYFTHQNELAYQEQVQTSYANQVSLLHGPHPPGPTGFVGGGKLWLICTLKGQCCWPTLPNVWL
jgi:hypothetical protein